MRSRAGVRFIVLVCGATVIGVSLIGCADHSRADTGDGAGFELARKDHGPLDASPTDAAGCSGPNPSSSNGSGVFCHSHLNYICLDIGCDHVCIEGQWQCPEPGMIPDRDCRGWSNMPRDIGAPDHDLFDDGGDASMADAVSDD